MGFSPHPGTDWPPHKGLDAELEEMFSQERAQRSLGDRSTQVRQRGTRSHRSRRVARTAGTSGDDSGGDGQPGHPSPPGVKRTAVDHLVADGIRLSQDGAR